MPATLNAANSTQRLKVFHLTRPASIETGANRGYMNQPPIQLTAAHYDAMLAAANKIPGIVGKEMEWRRHSWTYGSPANLDVQHAGPGPVQTVVSQAMQFQTQGADHLAALVRALTSPVMTMAPWTLARGTLESCATLLWLLDTSSTTDVRLGKSLSLRRDDLAEQVKYFRMKGHSDQSGAETLAKRAETRSASLEATAKARNIQVIYDKNGAVRGFGEALPSIIELTELCGMELDYRVYSGVAHGKPWASLPIGYQVVSKNIVTQNLDPLHAMTLLAASLDLWLRCAGRLFAYQGWDMTACAPDCDPLMDAASLRDAIRPWR
jgi:hypothetical protein